jgi:hypothetical protein
LDRARAGLRGRVARGRGRPPGTRIQFSRPGRPSRGGLKAIGHQRFGSWRMNNRRRPRSRLRWRLQCPTSIVSRGPRTGCLPPTGSGRGMVRERKLFGIASSSSSRRRPGRRRGSRNSLGKQLELAGAHRKPPNPCPHQGRWFLARAGPRAWDQRAGAIRRAGTRSASSRSRSFARRVDSRGVRRGRQVPHARWSAAFRPRSWLARRWT